MWWVRVGLKPIHSWLRLCLALLTHEPIAVEMFTSAVEQATLLAGHARK